MSLTHEDRRKRRKKIAEYAKTHTDKETATEFGVHPMTVINARNEHGVIKKSTGAPSTYQIVAAMIRGERQVDVARRLGCSKQFVNQCKDRMIEHGVFDAVSDSANSYRCGVVRKLKP